MDFDAKQRYRMRFPSQVSMDPELAGQIHTRAARRRRTPGQQIIHLLTIGVLHDPEETGNERVLTRAHGDAQALTGQQVEGHFSAQPRTASHGPARRKQGIA